MSEKPLPYNDTLPESLLREKIETQWLDIISYYRNVDRYINNPNQIQKNRSQNRMLMSGRPDVVAFCKDMNNLVGISDYVLVVEIGRVQKLFQEGVLSIEDIETSPIHKYLMRGSSASTTTELTIRRAMGKLEPKGF